MKIHFRMAHNFKKQIYIQSYTDKFYFQNFISKIKFWELSYDTYQISKILFLKLYF